MAVEGETVGGLSLLISTDKPVYKVGEPIVLTLRLVSRTQDEVRLEFSDSQRYDFVIRDPAGREVWRWSRDQVFAQVLGTEIIGPARPQLEFQTRFSGPLGQGVYRIEGSLPARGHRLSATLTIQVR
jgi:intracellular proteinase inhibitor BsuPI